MREAIVQLLLFVAAVSVATLLVGVVVTETVRYSQSVGDAGDRSSAEIDAEIVLVADPEAGAIANDDSITLYVKNIGGATLDPADLDVLVDGTYHEPAGTTVLEGETWRPGALLEVTIETSLEAGEHRVVVRIQGGEDRIEFDT